MKIIGRHLPLIGIVMLATFAGAAAGFYWNVPERIQRTIHAKPAASQYACPMHPDVVRSAPANCPRCGMKLVALIQAGAGESGGGCCGNPEGTAPGMAAGAMCPHMTATTNAPSGLSAGTVCPYMSAMTNSPAVSSDPHP